ncbi:acylphosphatase [Tersicoccus sp. Bi-70]|uniref:acylphosphatase n=1 Tax=Tersicoccus sp. Bi-70 TaxID=1897634 RepID=UPI00097765CA|nr:acylphosphatase [Tersicoccus sp. Bi-70]OMH32364.1 acylphosphatase [Tersicoccus sp. Bi-70]
MGVTSEPSRLTAVISGMVQGVGFRFWVREQADRLRLSGSASNRADGTVRVVVEGSRHDCEDLLTRLTSGRTPGTVEHVRSEFSDATGQFQGFTVS